MPQVSLDARAAAMPGQSVNLGNVARGESGRSTAATFMLPARSRLPGESGYRHHAVAVTLVLGGERSYSVVDGGRVDCHISLG